MKGETIKAKTSEIYKSVRIRCLKILDSFRFLYASSDTISTIRNSHPLLDAIIMEYDILKRKIVCFLKNLKQLSYLTNQ